MPLNKALTHASKPLAVALLFAVAAPAQAQSIDMNAAWPSVQFPKEGAFSASEAAKKLPGEERAEVEAQRFFLLRPFQPADVDGSDLN